MRFVGRLFMKKVLLVLLFVLLSCGKSEVKVTPDESKIAGSAMEVIQQIRQMYQDHNKSALKELSTQEGYLGYLSATKDFDTASLTFTSKWVDVKDSTVEVNVTWKGSWKKGDTVSNEKGLCTFVLTRQPMKLLQILRENPFNYPR
ncbi:lipoprotein [Candidatus Magnetobacterium bavaricum]|uniref:Lipoprotein n=1 Tax=Candidatus Magnetobacterium bavaricum TaxID=29290 RepID=A0A0F3H043_9BACT|nr:lipoprotein [Candidatus Magnetobacterium bavaricum]